MIFFAIFAFGIAGSINCFNLRTQRSIDLSASHVLIPDARLSKDVVPINYIINLHPNLEDNSFKGRIKMNLSWIEDTKKISLHAHYDLNVNDRTIKLKKIAKKNDNDHFNVTKFDNVPILRADRLPKKTVYVIYLKETIKRGTECELEMEFDGHIWESTEGLYKGTYNSEKNQKIYLATSMRPNNARRVFPCFDEPAFKVPFTVTIARPKIYTTIFNTPLLKTEELDEHYVIDVFETTPPMSTFTFGFVTSQLQKYIPGGTNTSGTSQTINIWSKPEASSNLEEVHSKLLKACSFLENYFNVSLPLSKIDVLAIPGLLSIRPSDSWGILIFKESELLKNGYYGLTQELIYQWLGSWVTPFWWSDAHVNKALASFLAAEIIMEIDGGVEFNGKYPMTILYSLYYELSKRYPHSRITGMKQESNSFKTELVLRMLNFTLSANRNIFKNGIRKFIADKHFGTFFADDIWAALTKEAISNGILNKQFNIAEIAESWIRNDRLPVVIVKRNYRQQTAAVHQKVYLRERPHDVPDREKMLWWIPLVLVTQNNLNFKNSTPWTWVEKRREATIHNLPDATQFIIVNPEEIGPFPVNYDENNWNLLLNFLLEDSQRIKIPSYTRAKILHDAWNLAYAGDLSFATAFNMTLFMKNERDHVVWNPVFTFIDHIGRHIDVSAVHKKFETYVRVLLIPLYEELEDPKENEGNSDSSLRTLSKTFLCRCGYKPCIEEAQNAYKRWMESLIPDAINPVSNEYICPVFKWGTIEEWEFGLQRVINFPKNRTQSERTYLLKTLAGCPTQSEKINRLLNLIILEASGNFTENDVFLVFNMLTSGSNGYITLFNFMIDNWQLVKQRFENKANLWDNLIRSATGFFITQEGYNMVKKLHEDHAGEFGSAEHIIEKSLRNIKEEAKWSSENLPVIEKWLDEFLASTKEINK